MPATPQQLIAHVVSKRQALWFQNLDDNGLPPVTLARQISQTAGSLITQIKAAPNAVSTATIDAAFAAIAPTAV